MISKATSRPLALAAVVVCSFMIAIEATIVSTAMPQIVGELGGLQLYSWVFSAFLLTQTATTVVFGKLSDRIGRRTVILWGLVVFLLGSALCGFAWSMPSLIAFRLIQGVGAGAIQPTSMTIVGDLYSAHERGRIQGYLASVWALSAVLGPLAGGLLVQHVSWAWIFWVNLPIGALAGFLFIRFLHENVGPKEGHIDHLSAGVFAIAIAAVMADLTAMSSASGREIAALTLIAAVAIALFVVQERRSPEPMISMKLWGRRTIAAANAAALLSGVTMIGLTTFLPVFVQGVMRQSALTAGFALSAMVLGWPIGATLSARLLTRLGPQIILRIGGFMIPVGAGLFTLIDSGSSPWVAGLGSALVGFGMGFLSSQSITTIQEIVEWGERGAATSAFLFARSLGNTFGATLFGAILNWRLAAAGFGAVSSEQLRGLTQSGAAAGGLRDALAGSLHVTFLTMFAVGLGVAAVTLAIPKIKLKPRSPA